MDRRFKRAAVGVASCAAAAFVATLVADRSGEPLGTQLVVPQAQISEADVTQPSSQSSSQATVSIPLPSPSIGTVGTTLTPSTPERRQPVEPQPRPPASTTTATTAPAPTAVDFQAEHAWIEKGWVASNHSGFTGSGFVDYDAAPGAFIEWAVTATTAGGANVVFRFANGSGEARLMAISVNGARAGYAFFPATNGWWDWRTVTVHTNLPAGTTRIRATAVSQNGGPNVDKITVVTPA